MRVRVYVVLVVLNCIEAQYPETSALLVRCAVLFICEYV